MPSSVCSPHSGPAFDEASCYVKSCNLLDDVPGSAKKGRMQCRIGDRERVHQVDYR